MTELDHARALYEDAAEAADGQTKTTLADTLEQRARVIRGEPGVQENVRETSAEVRDEIADALVGMPTQDHGRIADRLEETADTLKKVFRTVNPKAQKLPGDTAAQARLQSTEMWVDFQKLPEGEGQVIDEKVAVGLREHELEHNAQSSQPDAEGITVHEQTFEKEKLWEIAAMSRQEEVSPTSIAALSDHYRAMHESLMFGERERRLVRQGRFRKLEAVLNGNEVLAA